MRKFLAYICAAAALSAPLVAFPAASATAATGSSAGRSAITAPAFGRFGFNCHIYGSTSYTYCDAIDLGPGDVLVIRLSRTSTVTPVDAILVYTYVGSLHKFGQSNPKVGFEPRSGAWYVGRNKTGRQVRVALWAKPSHGVGSGTLSGTFLRFP